jgi:transcriptional regulator with XRE-family HTH domain
MAVNTALVKARTDARLSQDELARKVRDSGHALGKNNTCNRTTIARWESGHATPQPAMLHALEVALDLPASALGFGEAPEGIPWLGPPAFPAAALAGEWVTVYQFTHSPDWGPDRQPCHHADIAHVTAESDRHLRITNGPARTEGRAVPFLNEVEVQLSGRHLIGDWRNTSDTRYFGTVHLAALPGETVLSGYYTGLASDITVSMSPWRWVRLAGATADIVLAEPAKIYSMVMAHLPTDAPLTASGIGEEPY